MQENITDSAILGMEWEDFPPPNSKIVNKNGGGNGLGLEEDEKKKKRRKMIFIYCVSFAVFAILAALIVGAAVGIYTDEESKEKISTESPTKTPTSATSVPTTLVTLTPTTSLPSIAPTNSPKTIAPTNSPTTIAPTNSPTTSAPTNAPTTSAPTFSPTLNPTQSPTPPTQSPTSAPTPFQLFPQETFVGDDENGFISLLFLNDPGPQVLGIFSNATARWNALLDGSQELLRGSSDPNVQNIKSYENLCNESLDLEDVNVDHLRIIVNYESLASEEFSRTDECAYENGYPAVGLLFINSDIFVNDTLKFLDSVIAHQFGHILGMGTLWVENSLIENATFDENGGVFPDNQPAYLGLAAREAYQESSSDSSLPDFVPIYRGFTNGVQEFDPVADGPSLFDKHWEEDSLPGELMNFRILEFMPISAVTIGAMEDLGYFVNYTLADDFVALPFDGQTFDAPLRRGMKDEDVLILHQKVQP